MRDRIRLHANAKLNLSLDVTGVREDGYHTVDMINCSVTLFDELELVLTPGSQFSIRSNVRYLPTDERNLIWKAAKKLTENLDTGSDVPVKLVVMGGDGTLNEVMNGIILLLVSF